MSPPYGLTSAGYVPRRAADWLIIIRTEYESRTGLTIDWERDEVLGDWSVIVADRLAEIDASAQEVYNARDPANATNINLGNLCVIVGVTRLPSTKSTVTLTCTGAVGIVILVGDRCRGGGDDGNAEWEATEDQTIPAAGFIDVEFEAIETGQTEAAIGAITTIVTPKSGWTAVTNAADANPGRDRETDAALRTRRQQSLQQSGSGNASAIRANLLEIESVEAATVIDNDTPGIVVVSGITMVPHSILVVIWPNTLTAAQELTVAETIYERLVPGVATNGSELHTVVQADSGTKTVRFEYATTLSVDVTVTVQLALGYVLADVEAPIEEIVTDIFATFAPGDELFDLMFEAPIGSQLSTYLERVEVTFDIGSGPVTTVTPTAVQLPIEGTTTVTT